MEVVHKKPRMKRVQIRLTPEQYEAARRLAKERGVSMSQIFREALECLDRAYHANRHEELGSLDNPIGIVDDGDPNASVDHDRILFDQPSDDHD